MLNTPPYFLHVYIQKPTNTELQCTRYTHTVGIHFLQRTNAQSMIPLESITFLKHFETKNGKYLLFFVQSGKFHFLPWETQLDISGEDLPIDTTLGR